MEWLVGDEREVLERLVDDQREQILALLDQGLSEEEVRERLVPSLTTVLGLVTHATFVERIWFHSRVAGVHRRELGLPDTVEESFELAADDTIDSVRSAYLAACEESRRIAAGHDLAERFTWREVSVNLRWIHGHMVRELARHAGHGDILVEQLLARRSESTSGR